MAWIDPGAETLWVYHRLATIVAWVNQAFRFELLGFADALQYTQYGPGHKFDWHVDTGAGAASNRKLSMTVQLSNESDYEGSARQFISAPDMAMAKMRGTAILFPAYLAHRVSDVTAVLAGRMGGGHAVWMIRFSRCHWARAAIQQPVPPNSRA